MLQGPSPPGTWAPMRNAFHAGPGWAVLSALLLLISCLAPDRGAQDELRARSLSIVDEQGRAVVVIGADARGGRVAVRSVEGEELISLAGDARGGELQVLRGDGTVGVRLFIGPITPTTAAGTVDVLDANGETAVVLSSGAAWGGPVSMGAGVRGGVLGLFRDGAGHLLDPLALDRMKAAHPAEER